MYEYFQDLVTIAFDFDGTDRGARKFAFAQLMISVVIVVGVPFKVMMVIGDYIRNRRADAHLYNEVTADMPFDGAPELKHDLIAREKANRRSAYAAPLLPPIDLTTKPTDGSYFVTLREFADAKKETGKALNAYENEACGPVGFLFDCFGPEGFGHFDTLSGAAPFRSHELRAVMERLGMDDMVNAVEESTAIRLQRYQMYLDCIATGMPAEQAEAHPGLKSYDPLNETVKARGGQDRFLRAANQYFEAAYPWMPDGSF
jgi:hypothetical protein